MNRRNKNLSFIKSVLAGICIGIGGALYLSVNGGVIGSMLFSIGLILVLFMDFHLYTGKVPYLRYSIDSLPKTSRNILILVIGNIIGASGLGIILSFVKPEIRETAIRLCYMKLSEKWMVIPLAILCNVMIFFAVEAYKRQTDAVAIMIMVTLCVMAFILCGFEHSIANAFYFAAARMFDLEMILYLLLNVIFNGVGGVLICKLVKLSRQK